MILPVKRVAAIHDLSGFGRSSLMAIIPILSTMGHQVCPVPTAVLSSHTGGFEGYSFVDLTDSMQDYINHWKRLKLEFDCIYSGFLGSSKQIDIVLDFVNYFSNDHNLTVVDPVMGDDGKLYSTMGYDMVERMKKLVEKADIITPNFTEAAYLLGKSYSLEINDKEMKKWLLELSKMGPECVIITSVPDANSKKKTRTIAYDKRHDKYWNVTCQYIPASFPGTGDAFTSVIIGSLLQGDSLPIALDRGVQFITACIRASYGFGYPEREGVLLERVLNNLNLPVLTSSYEVMD